MVNGELVHQDVEGRHEDIGDLQSKGDLEGFLGKDLDKLRVRRRQEPLSDAVSLHSHKLAKRVTSAGEEVIN